MVARKCKKSPHESLIRPAGTFSKRRREKDEYITDVQVSDTTGDPQSADACQQKEKQQWNARITTV